MNRTIFMLRLAFKSLWVRRSTIILSALCIALSAALLLSIERLRTATRASFTGVISDTDVILGARAGNVQLLLYSVFHMGAASNNITWQSYQDIAKHPAVEWILPLSMGDSHRGFRVVGTSKAYFQHYRYRQGQKLRFTTGKAFNQLYDVVLGAEVARKLGYQLGDRIIVSHGLGQASLADHKDKPFQVSGILAATGGPNDRALFVSLEAIEAIHMDWRNGRPMPPAAGSAEITNQTDLTPQAITAALVRLKSRLTVFDFQRSVNTYAEEPLTAILPGIALQELWSVIGAAETALQVVAFITLLAAALGLCVMLLAALNERRREMAILRSIGARPMTIASLLMAEAMVVTLLGLMIGLGLHMAVLLVAQNWLLTEYGLLLALDNFGAETWLAFGAALLLGSLSGLWPAWRAYHLALIDGIGLRL